MPISYLFVHARWRIMWKNNNIIATILIDQMIIEKKKMKKNSTLFNRELFGDLSDSDLEVW